MRNIDFNEMLSDNEQCLKYLYNIRWENGYRCPRCNHSEKWDVGEFKYKCRQCGYQTTVVAGTLFHHSHLDLQLWYNAVLQVTSNPYTANNSSIQKLLGINYKSAYKVFNKIQWAMINYDEKLQGKVVWGAFGHYLEDRYALFIVAGEVVNKKLCKIRFKCYDEDDIHDPEIFNDFYSRYFSNKKLRLSHVYIFNQDNNIIYNQTDLTGFKTFDFGFKYFKELFMIIGRINIGGINNTDEMNRALDKFCAYYNSRYSSLSFDDVLKNAVKCDECKGDISPRLYVTKNYSF